MKRQRKIVILVLSILTMLGIWELVALRVDNPLILPAPPSVCIALFQIFSEASFWQNAGSTVLRGIAGFGLALILAFLTAIPAGIFESFRVFLTPFLVTIRSVPVITFILLALIWFHPPQVPVFIGFLTMYPIICGNLITGIQETDRELVQMARSYRMRLSSIIRHVYIPSTLPVLFAGISTAMGFGWRAIIIGEVLSQPKYGIGTRMQLSQIYLLVHDLIAWTVFAVIISYLFERLIRMIERKVVDWRNEGKG